MSELTAELSGLQLGIGLGREASRGFKWSPLTAESDVSRMGGVTSGDYMKYLFGAAILFFLLTFFDFATRRVSAAQYK